MKTYINVTAGSLVCELLAIKTQYKPETCFVSDKPEIYKGAIAVEFTGLPSINLVSVRLKKDSKWYQRIAEATRRRYFTLEKDWQITLDEIKYKADLNGIITIPRSVKETTVVFDGASVPMPWLVSVLNLGILRPMGVMLTASILHDFAYKYGYLLVTKKGGTTSQKVEVERHVIDRLFRDVIATVNQINFRGWFPGISYVSGGLSE